MQQNAWLKGAAIAWSRFYATAIRSISCVDVPMLWSDEEPTLKGSPTHAWQPLYQTLKPDQKKRMAFLTLLVLRDISDARARIENDEED